MVRSKSQPTRGRAEHDGIERPTGWKAAASWWLNMAFEDGGNTIDCWEKAVSLSLKLGVSDNAIGGVRVAGRADHTIGERIRGLQPPLECVVE